MKHYIGRYDDLGIQVEVVVPEEINVYDVWQYDDKHRFIPDEIPVVESETPTVH